MHHDVVVLGLHPQGDARGPGTQKPPGHTSHWAPGCWQAGTVTCSVWGAAEPQPILTPAGATTVSRAAALLRTQSPAFAKNGGTASPDGSGTKAVVLKKTLSATNGLPEGTFDTPVSQATTDEFASVATNDLGAASFALVQADELTRSHTPATHNALMHGS